jgi:hypothetical protein
MPRDFDPEVEADRQRRESAPTPPAIEELQHNDPRLRRLAALYDHKPEPVVETWPCRTGCGARIDMTATAIATAREWNLKLQDQGAPALTKRDVMLCSDCRKLDAQRAVAESIARAQSIAALSNELRRGVLPWREAAIADELRGLGVERPEQLIKQITDEKRNAAPTGARSKSL